MIISKFSKYLIIVALLIIVPLCTFAGWVLYNKHFLSKTLITSEIFIEKGDSFNKIYSTIFNEMNVPPGFRIYLSKFEDYPQKLKYGYYTASEISAKELLDNIANGIESTLKVTVPEGFNIFQIAAALERLNIARKDEFIDLAFDENFVKTITGLSIESMEGMLYPGTYQFPKHTSAKKIIEAMYSAYMKTLPSDFNEKAAAHKLTPYEALILASIVQKETYSAEEAPIVASVFLNRLKLRMRLQADPTIIYGNYLNFDGNIRKTDILDASNVFNTYRHGGLPPTPICNPSVIALNAVIAPADTDYLYFVADNNGKHLFSEDYRMHVNNVRKYQPK